MKKILPEFKPDLLIISVLQIMDSYRFKEGERMNRLKMVHAQMRNQPPSPKIHFEMASFVEGSLMLDLNEIIIPYADSIGINEQEIVNLCNSL